MPPSAVLATLTHIWPRLESSGIPAAIAGGIALSYWGNPRSTQDVDLAMYTDHFDSIRAILVQALDRSGRCPTPVRDTRRQTRPILFEPLVSIAKGS